MHEINYCVFEGLELKCKNYRIKYILGNEGRCHQGVGFQTLFPLRTYLLAYLILFVSESLFCLFLIVFGFQSEQVTFEVKGGERDGMVYEGEMKFGEVTGSGITYHVNGAKR